MSEQALVDDEFVSGYLDGGDLTAPEPSANRSHRYRHSFAIRRAEIEGRPLPSYHALLAAANIAEAKDMQR